MSTDADTAASATVAASATASAAPADGSTSPPEKSNAKPTVPSSLQQADPISLLTEISKINSSFRDKVKLFKNKIDELIDDDDDDDDDNDSGSDTDGSDIEEYDIETNLNLNLNVEFLGKIGPKKRERLIVLL